MKDTVKSTRIQLESQKEMRDWGTGKPGRDNC